MSAPVAVAVLTGAMTGLGLLYLWVAVRGGRAATGPTIGDRVRAWWGEVRRDAAARRRAAWWIGIGAVAVLLAATVRWPAAVPVALLGGWAVPVLMGPDRWARRHMAHVQAIAEWTESVRDAVHAGAGLQEAIVTTARIAPAAIRAPLTRLADDVTGDGATGPALTGDRDVLRAALYALRDTLADPGADMVVSVLRQAVDFPAARLGPALSTLADEMRRDVRWRRDVDADRASPRAALRLVVGIGVGFIALVVTVNVDYQAAALSWGGQLVVTLCAALIALAAVVVRRISRVSRPTRVLAPTVVSGEEA